MVVTQSEFEGLRTREGTGIYPTPWEVLSAGGERNDRG